MTDPAILLKLVAELSLWFSAAGLLLSSFVSGFSLLQPLSLALAGYISSLLANKKPAVRALPLVPMAVLAAALWVDSIASALVVLPPLGYLFALAIMNRFSPDKDGFASFFRAAALIVPVLMLFALLLGAGEAVLSFAAPAALLFLVSGTVLSRLLRHDVATRREPRFILISVAAPLAACALAFFISRPGFLGAVKGVAGFFYNTVISPVLMLAAYAMFGIFWLIKLLVSLLIGEVSPEENEIQMQLEEAAEQFQEMGEADGSGDVFWRIVTALGIIVFILVAFLIFRRLLGNKHSAAKAEQRREERLAPAPFKPKLPAFLRPRTPADLVRAYFRRFLQKARDAGAAIKPCDTTAEIMAASLPFFDEAMLGEFRSIYLLARYSPRGVSRDEAKRAKELYEGLKKGARENGI